MDIDLTGGPTEHYVYLILIHMLIDIESATSLQSDETVSIYRLFET